MAKGGNIQTEKPRRFARKILVPLALVVAVGGFVTGVLGGPLVGSGAADVVGAVIQLQAGPFPIVSEGSVMKMVKANVSVRAGGAAPDGPGPLHDAVFDLLTQAVALPLVKDGRQSLPELEKVVMSMAQNTAPWLVALQLQPADMSTAAVELERAAAKTAS